MKPIAEAFAELVSERLKALGTNAFSIETQFDLPEDSVRNVLRSTKKDGPSLSKAKEICDALDLEIYVGHRRETGPVEHTIINGEDFAAIPRLSVRLSAGAGANNEDESVIETLAFRREWLNQLGVNPSECVIVSIFGDSMEPGLHDGDLALIDQGKKVPRPGCIYALTDFDGSTRVKRIDLLPETGLILRSDNPQYPVEPRLNHDAERVEVIGQVVWSGHTHKE